MPPLLFRRRTRLIKPRLQLRLIGAFLTAALTATLVHVISLNTALARLAARLPNDHSALLEEWPTILRDSLLLTLPLMAALTIGIGILATFRIAGPVYRFEHFLRKVAVGKHPEPCRLRKGDELQDLCELLNQTTAQLREQQLQPGRRREAPGLIRRLTA